jgi:aconitase A
MIPAAEKAEQLLEDTYDNMYVEINALSRTFKFSRPTIKWFIDGLRDKSKQQVVLMIDEFLAYIAEVWGDDNDEYAYWEDVKTAVQNL